MGVTEIRSTAIVGASTEGRQEISLKIRDIELMSIYLKSADLWENYTAHYQQYSLLLLELCRSEKTSVQR